MGRRNGRGLAGSVLLHGAVWLVLLLWPKPDFPPIADEPVIQVQLVQLADQTAAPVIQKTKAMPRQAAPRAAASVTKPAARHVPPLAPPSPIPPDDFDAKLRNAEQALAQHGTGGRGQAESPIGALRLGGKATYSVKDYVRVQIVRHWTFNAAVLGSARWVVPVHVVLDVDGGVTSVDTLADAALRENLAYQALVKSVRDAVLMASPLHLPGQLTPEQRDMVLEFDPAMALR